MKAMLVLGVPLLGRTFDPLDFLMFGAGVGLAVLLDRVVPLRLLPHWAPSTTEPPTDIRSRAL